MKVLAVRLGAHVSIAGGISNAVDRAVAIGADCLQVFVSSPRMWKPPHHSDEEVTHFNQRRAETGIGPLFVHTIYLLSFGSADPEQSARSVESLALAMRWASILKADGVITHLGSDAAKDEPPAEERVAGAIGAALDLSPGNMPLLLETSAGRTMGNRFAQLGRIIRLLNSHPRLAVCLDTAHVFAAGYDLTTARGLKLMLSEFDAEIGIERLLAIHANDSKRPLGSGLDRHENIGRGYLGVRTFSRLLRHPLLRDLPFIIEVPGFGEEGPDRENLEILRRLAGRQSNQGGRQG